MVSQEEDLLLYANNFIISDFNFEQMSSRVIFLLSALLLPTLVVNGQEYGGEGGANYEAPAKNTKFNIGFNLPAMSISLPKLELPQISIKASMKNKKPFTLQLPIIKFNAHASTEEEESYPSNKGYGDNGGNYASSGNYGGGEQANSYGGSQGGQSYGNVPMVYASSTASGASGYASAGDAAPQSYGASNVGYERPAAGQYGDVNGQVEPAYAGSGYVPAPAQYAQQPSGYSSTQGNYQQQQPQQQYSNQAAPTYQDFKAPAAASPYPATQPAAAANGYYVPRPVFVGQYNQNNLNNNGNNIQYMDENTRYYGASNTYNQQQQPLLNAMYVHATSPDNAGYVSNLHGNNMNNRYGRRSTRPHVEKVGGVFLASSSDGQGTYVLAPMTEEDTKWRPIIRR